MLASRCLPISDCQSRLAGWQDGSVVYLLITAILVRIMFSFLCEREARHGSLGLVTVSSLSGRQREEIREFPLTDGAQAPLLITSRALI